MDGYDRMLPVMAAEINFNLRIVVGAKDARIANGRSRLEFTAHASIFIRSDYRTVGPAHFLSREVKDTSLHGRACVRAWARGH